MSEAIDTTGSSGRARLTAIPGGRAATLEAPAVEECVVSRGAVRAGDRHDPWTLPASDAWRRLAGVAYAMGVDFELAGRLAIESALATADVRAAGIDPTVLDAAAARERVEARLDAATAAYLRRLTQCGDADRRDVGDVVTLGLPVRLSARLLDADLDALVASADLARAVRWEVAAVLAGRTISEWAPLTALRALSATS